VCMNVTQRCDFFGGYVTTLLAKIKSSSCLTKHYAMKAYGGVDV
jgi:hypothetical protein